MPNDLILLANDINKSWGSRETVDWSEAEQLVSLIKELPERIVANTDLVFILEYADANEDWDSGFVGTWPETVVTVLSGEAS